MDFDTKDAPPGDLIFILQQRPHSTFTRKGHDLAMRLTISLQEAMVGCTKTIRHLDGREIVLESAKEESHPSFLSGLHLPHLHGHSDEVSTLEEEDDEEKEVEETETSEKSNDKAP